MIWPRWLTGLLFVGGLLLLALIAKLAGKLSDRFGETWVPPEQREEEARRRKEEAARRAEPEPVPRERPAGPEEPRGPVYPPFFWKAAIPCMAVCVLLGVWLLGVRVNRWTMLFYLVGLAVVLARFGFAAWRGHDRRAVHFGAALALLSIFPGLRFLYAAFIVAEFTEGPVSPEPYVTGAVYFVASLVVLMLLPRLTRWWDRRQHRAPVDPWDLA